MTDFQDGAHHILTPETLKLWPDPSLILRAVNVVKRWPDSIEGNDNADDFSIKRFLNQLKDPKFSTPLRIGRKKKKRGRLIEKRIKKSRTWRKMKTRSGRK